MCIFETCEFVRNNIQFYSPIKTIKRHNKTENKAKVSTINYFPAIKSGPHSMLI